LPPLWFDKKPGKSFERQIEEMQLVIRVAAEAFADELRNPREFLASWQAAYNSVHSWTAQHALPALLASFGVSMLERAIMDAMLRASGKSFHEGVRENLFLGADGGFRISRDSLPVTPRRSVFVRHTVGLSDPLTRSQLAHDDDPADGFPVTLEEHLRDYGIRYLKIKVSNQLERDLERLRSIASLAEKYRGPDYFVTLDGNEQYNVGAQLEELVAAIERDSKLETLWANTLVIEQPLSRAIALDQRHTESVRTISHRKPVIIDESDDDLRSFVKAIDLGYRGVSSKSCKGPLKSLVNAALVWTNNQSAQASSLVMTAEDLCTVGVVPVQADLCLVATLGLTHVERNGHHYHPGLSYLPEAEQEAALTFHGDLYERRAGRVAPRIVDGQFQIGSLQCVGFGFAVLPDMNEREIVWEV
jgi:hypothetical protein